VSSRGRVWWKEEAGMGASGDEKSNRRASIIIGTARLCVGGSMHSSLEHSVKLGKERRVNRNFRS
jgi:hypothetical protein